MAGGVWMFGYGSLIWKIDFPFIRRVTGYVEGFTRTMEWADEVHRGVPGNQSRTAAIFSSPNPRERVWGVAYEISRDFWDRVLEEKVGYRERGGYGTVDVEFHPFDPSGHVTEKINVTLFLGDKNSPNYKPGTIDEIAQQVVRAVGASGTNLEYVINTAESLRMILPPGETDKHLFDLEEACKKWEERERLKSKVQLPSVLLDEKYEKRRALLVQIFRAVDKNVDRELGLEEFTNLSLNILNLNKTSDEIKEKFETIDKDKNGKLSTREFIDYFLEAVQENEEQFKDEYDSNGLEYSTQNNFENSLLLYETMLEINKEGKKETSLKKLIAQNRDIIKKIGVTTNPRATKVLDFWFPDTMQAAMTLWVGRCPNNDAKIKEKFSQLTRDALDGSLDHWLCTPVDCLALVIVLTQFTRAIYRGTPEMFSGDDKAMGVTTMAIFRGYTRALPPLQSVFLPCIALSCQENLHCHELAAEIWINYISPKLSKDDPLRIIQNNFTNSLRIIKKFGRFPHRNQILGRESTEDEEAFMEQVKEKDNKPVRFGADGRPEGRDGALTSLLFKGLESSKEAGQETDTLPKDTIPSLHTRD